MTSTQIAIIALSSIVSLLVGNFLGSAKGYVSGFRAGMKDEQIWMGLAITRAFSDNKEEALDKVLTEYNRMYVELQQKVENQ